jgi:tRNA nucleotidyltransferase (CCA-adding enzyme)
MNDLESRRMIAQRLDLDGIMEGLFRIKGDDNFGIYTLLSQYDTEILLFIMAKANNEKIKRIISNYFTRLKGKKVYLKGRDLKEIGFKPSPLYKEIFRRLLEASLNGKVGTKDDEIKFVKENFGEHLQM